MTAPKKLMSCDICKLSIFPSETFVGNGDGRGQRFAHSNCYYRKRSETLEEQLRLAMAGLEKIRSTNGLQYSDIFKICDETLAKMGEA